MKTLDEVIIGIKEQMGLGDPILIDALHYLKEYKDYQDTMCALPDYYEWIHSADNPPLTWDELRQMEGKPVWIYEPYNGEWHGNWAVICSVGEYDFNDDPYMSMTDDSFYLKSGCGTRWQAYRKEKYE